MDIFKSATKLVLLMLTIATIAALFVDKITATDFTPIVMMVIGYYFGRTQALPSQNG
jgi:hypothetical protein